MSLVHVQTETVRVELPVAPTYERVHFIAHCRFGSPDLKVLEDEVKARVVEVEEQVGYRCYFVGVKTSGVSPIWLDVDFIFDLPAESPVDPLTIGIIIAVLGLVLGIAFVLFLWWSVWHEESEVFYCDQCDTSHQGRADYDAHLNETHPEKWAFIEEQREKAYWWTEILKNIPMVIGLMLLMSLVAYIPKPRRED